MVGHSLARMTNVDGEAVAKYPSQHSHPHGIIKSPTSSRLQQQQQRRCSKQHSTTQRKAHRPSIPSPHRRRRRRRALLQRERERERERRTTNDERRTTNDERRTTNDERRTTNGERRTMNGDSATLPPLLRRCVGHWPLATENFSFLRSFVPPFLPSFLFYLSCGFCSRRRRRCRCCRCGVCKEGQARACVRRAAVWRVQWNGMQCNAMEDDRWNRIGPLYSLLSSSTT